MSNQNFCCNWDGGDFFGYSASPEHPILPSTEGGINIAEPPAPEHSEDAQLGAAPINEPSKNDESPVHDPAPPKVRTTQAGAGDAGDAEGSARPSEQISKYSNTLCLVVSLNRLLSGV